MGVTPPDTTFSAIQALGQLSVCRDAEFRHLDSQFPGGGYHQTLHLALTGLKVMQDGQRKCRGFSGTGLRLANHILPGKHGRNYSGLDRCRYGVADIADRLHQLRLQIKRSLTTRRLPSQPVPCYRIQLQFSFIVLIWERVCRKNPGGY